MRISGGYGRRSMSEGGGDSYYSKFAVTEVKSKR
jgi:hypothetical protein